MTTLVQHPWLVAPWEQGPSYRTVGMFHTISRRNDCGLRIVVLVLGQNTSRIQNVNFECVLFSIINLKSQTCVGLVVAW